MMEYRSSAHYHCLACCALSRAPHAPSSRSCPSRHDRRRACARRVKVREIVARQLIDHLFNNNIAIVYHLVKKDRADACNRSTPPGAGGRMHSFARSCGNAKAPRRRAHVSASRRLRVDRGKGRHFVRSGDASCGCGVAVPAAGYPAGSSTAAARGRRMMNVVPAPSSLSSSSSPPICSTRPREMARPSPTPGSCAVPSLR